MKKLLLLLCFAYLGFMAYGQNSLPNGDFESWNSGTFLYPQYYPFNSNMTTFIRQGIFNVNRVADPQHGAYAIKLETTTFKADTSFGYFVNIFPGNSSPNSWHGGMPYSQIPTGISGWYKYNVATADSGSIIVAFSNGGVNIKTYFFKLGGIHNTYTPFKFTFNPPLLQVPDSVEFGALSCKFGSGMTQPLGLAGSILIMDSVNFTGVASQPAAMNGDFELWQSQTIKTPVQWYILSSGDQETGVSQTTDAYQGTYAIEMKTFPGNQNGQPAAQTAGISTGYFPRNCTGSCTQLGGYPYTLKKDTLIFYYKYSPSGTDQALVNINFKKNGATVDYINWRLDATSVYKKAKLAFDILQTPDTVIVNILSSDWTNTGLTYVGSDLKVDSIYFKSQSVITGVDGMKGADDGSIVVYPNPSTGKFHISSTLSGIRSIEVYSVSGEKVYSDSNVRSRDITDLDLPLLRKGIYFIKIDDGVIVRTRKLVIK